MPEHSSTLVNRTLAHYRVLAQLGKGGMGEVYLAEDLRLRRRVALKVLPPDLAEEPRHLERFRREARSVAALNHPNIVTLYSVEEAEGLHFLVLEVVEGDTLADLLAQGPLPLERLLPIARALAEALEAAHACGVIHRDLKPRNVMVSREGRVKILDFGIARLTHTHDENREEDGAPETDLTKTGVVIGTPAYMSPEQIQGGSVTPRSDLFSLGVLLYEMATGQRPFQGTSQFSTMAAVLHHTPRLPSSLVEGLPDHFDWIVGRCLAKEPSLRYGDAAELRGDLQNLAQEPVVAEIDTEAETETFKPMILERAWDARVQIGPRLPAVSHCFGRENEVRELTAAICSEPAPPVPILGPAGAGKTTIALVALHDHRVIGRFGKRRFFVRCDSATNRDSLIGLIARSVCPEAVPPLDLKIFVELEKERSVLVLDNFETPWERDTAAVEELLSELAAVPELALIVALRGEQRPFGLSWREAIRAEPLDPGSARSTFLAVAGQRFEKDPDLAPLLSALEGLALAVVLLASQAEGEPDLSTLRKRWQDQRTALLRRAGAQERLQSLDISVRLSVDSPRMKEESRRLLSILGLLPEGVAQEDLLELLPRHGREAASMLRKVGLAFDQGDRLRTLAPIREHIRLHYPPLPEDLDQAIGHYLTLARLGEKIGSEGGAEATRRLLPEAGNLETLILLGLERADPSPAISSALAFAEFLRFTGSGGFVTLKEACRIARDRRNIKLEADCTRKHGDVELYRGHYDHAQDSYDRALLLYQNIDDRHGLACCLSALGEIHIGYTKPAQAQHLYQEAIRLFLELGDVTGQAHCLLGLGSAAHALSKYASAKAHMEHAHTLFKQIENVRGEANCLLHMAGCSVELRDFRSAETELDEALLLFRRIGSLLGEANCAKNKGAIALFQLDSKAAHPRFEEALTLSRRVGSLLGEANCLFGLARVQHIESNYKEAERLFEQARIKFDQIGNTIGVANSLKYLGDTAAAQLNVPRALHLLEKALEIFRRIPQPMGAGHTHLSMAILFSPGSPERLFHIEEARQVWEQAGLLDLLHDDLKAVAEARHFSP